MCARRVVMSTIRPCSSCWWIPPLLWSNHLIPTLCCLLLRHPKKSLSMVTRISLVAPYCLCVLSEILGTCFLWWHYHLCLQSILLYPCPAFKYLSRSQPPILFNMRWHSHRDEFPCWFFYPVQVYGVLRFFLFHMSFVFFLTYVPSHCSPERLPPKHSFLLIRCAWFPYSVSAYLLWTSFSYTCLPQRGSFASVTLPKPSLYIHLGSCTTNTAWSVHYLPPYLNDNTTCILLNLNLLDSPLKPGLL